MIDQNYFIPKGRPIFLLSLLDNYVRGILVHIKN